MNLIKLKELIDSEPSNASKSDADVHAWLMSDSIKYFPLSATLVGLGKIIFDSALLLNIIAGFKSAAASNSLVEEALIMTRAGEPIEWTNPLTMGVMSQVLTAEDYTKFTSYLTLKKNYEVGGFHKVHLYHVTEARS